MKNWLKNWLCRIELEVLDEKQRSIAVKEQLLDRFLSELDSVRAEHFRSNEAEREKLDRIVFEESRALQGRVDAFEAEKQKVALAWKELTDERNKQIEPILTAVESRYIAQLELQIKQNNEWLALWVEKFEKSYPEEQRARDLAKKFNVFKGRTAEGVAQ